MEEVSVDSIGDDSLIMQLYYTKCCSSVTTEHSRIIKYASFKSVRLALCEKKQMIKARKSSNIFHCDKGFLYEVSPDDLSIEQNKEFILFKLSNTFEMSCTINVINTEERSLKPRSGVFITVSNI